MTRAARTSPTRKTSDMQLFRQPRHRGLHLVAAGALPAPAVTNVRVMGEDWLRLQRAREARRLRLAAMALGAAFAPGVWLVHELLLRLKVI